MRLGGLNLRLRISAILSTIIFVTATGAVIAYLFKVYFEDRVRSELVAYLTQLTGHLTINANGEPEVLAMPDERFNQPLSGLYWQVVALGGDTILSRSLWDQKIDIPEPMRSGAVQINYVTPSPDTQFLAVSWKIKHGNYIKPQTVVLTVATDLLQVTRAAAQFRSAITAWLVLLAVALIAISGFQIRFALRPLETISAEIDKINRSTQIRLPRDFPTEVLPLVDGVNSLLDEQQESLEKARQGAGDLAHGLKTPLTIMNTLTRELRGTDQNAFADRIDEQVSAMQNFVERELVRSRTGSSSRNWCNLGTVAKRMVSAIRRLPKGDALDWQLDIPESINAPFDEYDLSELLGNLLDNARKYAKSQVFISACARDGTVRLIIQDDGPGVPEDLLEAILKRGKSLDHELQGQGLGLAIVKDLAESHDCNLKLRNDEAGGLSVEISWTALET